MPIIIEFELLDEEKILLEAIVKKDLNLISNVLAYYFSEEYQEEKRTEEKILDDAVRRVPDINVASGEAIFAAFATGNLAAIKLLVAKGGNLNLNRNYGYSSLTANPVWHYALVHFDNEGEILKFLLENNVPFGKRELYDALKIDNVAAFALLFKRYIALLQIADSSQAFQKIITDHFFYTFPTYNAIKPSPKVARVILEEFVADPEFKKELVMDGFCKELLATWDREENFQYFLACAQDLKIDLNQNFLQRFDKISGGIGHYDFLTLLDIAILSQKTAYVFLLLMSGVEFNLKNKLEILEHKSSAYYSIKELLHVAAAHDLLASLEEGNENSQELTTITSYIKEAFRIELDNKQPNAAWSDDGEKLLILLVNGRAPLNQFQLDKLYEIFKKMGIANDIANKKSEFKQAIDAMAETLAIKEEKRNNNVEKNEIDRDWSKSERLTSTDLIDEEKILLALIEKEASNLIGKVLDLYFSAEYLDRKRAEEVKVVGIPFRRMPNINVGNGKIIIAAFQTKNLEIIKLLVTKGANLNIIQVWSNAYSIKITKPLWNLAINHFALHKELFAYLVSQHADCDEQELYNLIEKNNPEAFILLFNHFIEIKKVTKNSSEYKTFVENFFLRKAMPWGHSDQGKIGIANCILSQLIDDQEFKKELVADGLFITLVTTLGNNPDFLQALLKMAKTYDVDLNKKFSKSQGKFKLITNLVMDVWWWKDGSTHVSFLDVCIRQELSRYVLPLLLAGTKFDLKESLEFVPRERFDDSTRRLLYLAAALDQLATLHEDLNSFEAKEIKTSIAQCMKEALQPKADKQDKYYANLSEECCGKFLTGVLAGKRVTLNKLQLKVLMEIPQVKDICFNVAPMQIAMVLSQHNLYPEKVVPLCLKLLYSLPSDTEVINKDEILRSLEKMAGFEKKENSRIAQENENKYWSKSPLKIDVQFSYLFFVMLLLQARLLQLDEVVLFKNCDKFLMSFSFSKYDSIWTELLLKKTLEQLSSLLVQAPSAVTKLLQKEANNVFKQENFFTAVLQQIFLMSKVSLKDDQSSINYLIGTLMTLGLKEVEKVEQKVIFPAV